jgi:hypothetical protein
VTRTRTRTRTRTPTQARTRSRSEGSRARGPAGRAGRLRLRVGRESRFRRRLGLAGVTATGTVALPVPVPCQWPRHCGTGTGSASASGNSGKFLRLRLRCHWQCIPSPGQVCFEPLTTVELAFFVAFNLKTVKSESWGPTKRLASESPLLRVVQARRIAALGDRTPVVLVLANLGSDRYHPGSLASERPVLVVRCHWQWVTGKRAAASASGPFWSSVASGDYYPGLAQVRITVQNASVT